MDIIEGRIGVSTQQGQAYGGAPWRGEGPLLLSALTVPTQDNRRNYTGHCCVPMGLVIPIFITLCEINITLTYLVSP